MRVTKRLPACTLSEAYVCAARDMFMMSQYKR